jgi:hypothetical protein
LLLQFYRFLIQLNGFVDCRVKSFQFQHHMSKFVRVLLMAFVHTRYREARESLVTYRL